MWHLLGFIFCLIIVSYDAVQWRLTGNLWYGFSTILFSGLGISEFIVMLELYS